MSPVQAAIAALGDVFPEVRWANTGGDCYAIECLLDADLGAAGGFVLVTPAEDVYTFGDLTDPDPSEGFYADEYDIHGDSRTRCEGFHYDQTGDLDALLAACRGRFG